MEPENTPLTRDASFAGWIGMSQEDITPPAAIYSRNWGAAQHETAEGIHRPLKLTCFTFQASENDPPLVLMSADLGWWKSAEDEKTLRNGILLEMGLKPSQLMFCLSHTHAGPGLFSEDASKPGGGHIAPYLRELKEKAISAIRQALRSSATSILAWRYGKCSLACNRDLRENGTERFILGMDPHKPADDTLLVGRVSGKQGNIRGTIVNYACHPTTLGWANRLLSPDYVGAMRELVEQDTQAPCLFLQGASGELAPREQYTDSTQLADTYGRELGYASLSVLEAMHLPATQLVFDKVVESGGPLAVWKKTAWHPSNQAAAEIKEIEMNLKPLPSMAEIERQWLSCSDHILKERLWRMRGIRKTVGDGTTTKISVWLWRLGDTLLAGQPGEAYSAFQQKLRRSVAPFPAAVMNIVNGYAGYLPPAGLYKEEMYAADITPFASGSMELLTETVIDSAKRIMSGERAQTRLK